MRRARSLGQARERPGDPRGRCPGVTQIQGNRTLKAVQGSGAEIAATVEEAERMLEGDRARSSVRS